jgi:hypothetical protein
MKQACQCEYKGEDKFFHICSFRFKIFGQEN